MQWILYNHESAGRGENFVTRKIARAAARISRGEESELVLGNTSTRRDWGHARDYVKAMWLMLQHDEPDDYVVATGESHSVQEFVAAAFAVVDLDCEKYVEHDSAFERPTEPCQLVGSSEKSSAPSVGVRAPPLKSLFGKWWRPSWRRYARSAREGGDFRLFREFQV